MSEQAATEPLEQGVGVANGQPAAGEEWQRDGRGRAYVKRPDGKGTIWRKGEESIAEALERDSAPQRDKRPRSSKGKTPRKPPAPKHVDLKALEAVLAEALSSPAMACAMFGDEWAANHFAQQGPLLARNLVVAAEHNPWLRRKLEALATGQDATAKVLAMLGVTGALIGYAVPPIVYWFNLPVPDKARQMLQIPPPRQHAESPETAAPPESAEPAEPAAAAAA